MKRLKVVRTSSAIIHRVADCANCNWRDEDHHHASVRARRHTAKTGHTTTVENGNFYEFKPAEGESLVDPNQMSLV